MSETGSALTIQTATEQLTIAKSGIPRRHKSKQSLMPRGLPETLNDREQTELLKYLTSNGRFDFG